MKNILSLMLYIVFYSIAVLLFLLAALQMGFAFVIAVSSFQTNHRSLYQLGILQIGFWVVGRFREFLFSIALPEKVASFLTYRMAIDLLALAQMAILVVVGVQSAFDLFLLAAVLLLIRLFKWLALLAKRARTVDAVQLMRKDRRRPILFLRSFKDDNMFSFKIPVHDKTGWWMLSLLFIEKPFEESIVTCFSKTGPVVAIGRPGEWLPPTGAAREYVHDALWQRRVSELMKQSKYIMITCGTTEGLLWEMQELVRLNIPRKIVIIFPPVSKKDLEQRWTMFRTIARQAGIRSLPHKLDDHAVFGVFSLQWTMRLITHTRMMRSSAMFLPEASMYKDCGLEIYQIHGNVYDYKLID
jgi:hypothetical protein